MSKIKKIIKKVKRTITFMEREVWQIPLRELPPRKSFLIKQLRILLLALRGFNEDNIPTKASALTYYSLLSIIPVVAMAFGIAKGFGLENFMEKQLSEAFSGREEVFNWIMEFSQSMLENARGGMVAGVGLIILLWTIFSILSNIETSFNQIWQIKHSRTFTRKLSDYFSMMFIAPVFLMLSSAAVVYLSAKVSDISEQIRLLGFISPILMFLINLIPYVLIWFMLTLVYMIMPNTNVRFGSAFIAAVIAGTIFIITQWGYIYFQVGVSRYNAIYGSFAAFPLLLLWMQVSWLIILLGAEISFANQNVEHYEFEHESKTISPFNKKVLSLFVFNFIAKRFATGQPAYTSAMISTELEMPIKIVREVLDDLVEIRLVNKVKTEHPKEDGYQPARDIHNIRVSSLIEMLDHKGADMLIAKNTPELQEVIHKLKAFANTLEQTHENVLVKDI